MARGEAIVTPERSHRVKELFPRIGVVMSFEDLFVHHFLKNPRRVGFVGSIKSG
jgi:hypothetical protein